MQICSYMYTLVYLEVIRRIHVDLLTCSLLPCPLCFVVDVFVEASGKSELRRSVLAVNVMDDR